MKKSPNKKILTSQHSFTSLLKMLTKKLLKIDFVSFVIKKSNRLLTKFERSFPNN